MTIKLIKIPSLPYKTDNNSSTPWMSYPIKLYSIVIRCHVPSVLHYYLQWCLQYFIKIHKNTIDTSLNHLKINPSVLINLPPQGCILINWNSPISVCIGLYFDRYISLFFYSDYAGIFLSSRATI